MTFELCRLASRGACNKVVESINNCSEARRKNEEILRICISSVDKRRKKDVMERDAKTTWFLSFAK